MAVEYDHAQNVHTINGPRAALPIFLSDWMPTSLLDVGCGTGTWLKAAVEFGVSEVLGVDGVDIPASQLLIDPRRFKHVDLRKPWTFNRRFDLILCLEVAEHLEERYATVLVEALVRHAEVVIFSAACPGQPGQNHVNCQWPVYWQALFNKQGYCCNDAVRWKIWNNPEIEPWYRQNTFIARHDIEAAGAEPRICSVLHPALQSWIPAEATSKSFLDHLAQIENGRMPVAWYFKTAVLGVVAKMRRLFGRCGIRDTQS